MEPENTKEPIFRRGLNNVTSPDLHEIEQLEEGWFVEFKSRVPDSQKLAKSISSFANAYGGLLVIGAEEDSKSRRLKSFVPMNQKAADDTKTIVRQAVEAHLQPCPIFFMKSVELPEISCESDDRWILLVHIPKGARAPFLHSNGSVYTRKGDSASPIALTDLGLLDRLWSEGKRKQEQLKERITFLCSQSSHKVPKIELIISVETDFSDDSENHRVTFSEFQSIASTPVGDGNNSLFNNAYPLDSSYVARHIQGHLDATSLIWDYDYVRKLHYIIIPLATQKWVGDAFDQDLVGHEELTMLSDYLSDQQEDQKNLFIVDLTPALMMMSIVLHMVNKLHRAGENQRMRLLVNARASGVRRSVIYVGLPRYREHLANSGLPFVHREVDFIYAIEKPDSWFEMQLEKAQTQIDENAGLPPNLDIGNSIYLFILIAESLGISNVVTIGADKHEFNNNYVKSLAETYNFLISRNLSFSVSENPGIV